MKKLLLILIFTRFLSLSQNGIIEVIHYVNVDNSVSFSYEKISPGSFLLILEFSSLTNTTESNSFKKAIKNSTVSLLKLKT